MLNSSFFIYDGIETIELLRVSYDGPLRKLVRILLKSCYVGKAELFYCGSSAAVKRSFSHSLSAWSLERRCGDVAHLVCLCLLDVCLVAALELLDKCFKLIRSGTVLTVAASSRELSEVELAARHKACELPHVIEFLSLGCWLIGARVLTGMLMHLTIYV